MYFKVGHHPVPPECLFLGNAPRYLPYPLLTLPLENDIVLVQKKTDASAKKILSKPLRPGKRLNTGLGHIDHESIIGQSPRAILSTESGKGAYRIYRPTLGEYTNLTSRIVTPVRVLHIPFFGREIWRLT